MLSALAAQGIPLVPGQSGRRRKRRSGDPEHGSALPPLVPKAPLQTPPLRARSRREQSHQHPPWPDARRNGDPIDGASPLPGLAFPSSRLCARIFLSVDGKLSSIAIGPLEESKMTAVSGKSPFNGGGFDPELRLFVQKDV